jgi:HPt (histidine-containing phosphotransfer) domain-containing protein
LLSFNQALNQTYNEAYKDKAYGKGAVDEKTLPLLTTQILALKSASAGIGAEKVSAQAALLEQAGKEGNLAEIREKLPDFCESLKSLIGLIQGTLGQSLPSVSATGGKCNGQ